MKKVNFKFFLTSFFIALSIVFLGSMEADAQSMLTTGGTSIGSGAIPQGDFVDSNEAQNILGDELADLKNQLGTVSNANDLASLESKYVYFTAIGENINSGVTVPKAIVKAFESLDSDASGNVLNTADQEALMQAAVDLLSI